MIRLSHLLACCALLFAVSVQAQGVMTFDTLEHDFGSVNEGEKPTHTFGFTNTGTAPLTLIAVQPSCGCTAPSYSTEAVAPGERGEIVVEYDSQGRPGDFNKSIAIRADGADPASATLRIRGSVVPVNIANGVEQGSVVFDADLRDLPSLEAAAPVAHVFRMQNTGERPIRIREARTFNDAVVVTFPQRPIFPGEIVEVEVAVAQASEAANARGHLDVAVVLDTDDVVQPAKSLRLRGQIEAQAGGTP